MKMTWKNSENDSRKKSQFYDKDHAKKSRKNRKKISGDYDSGGAVAQILTFVFKIFHLSLLTELFKKNGLIFENMRNFFWKFLKNFTKFFRVYLDKI